MNVCARGAPLVIAALLVGCDEDIQRAGPEDVVTQFIASMRQVHGDPKAGEQVVALLWEPARDNLKERARRASALSGRELAPGELLVPSWLALHVVPQRIDAREDGDWAEVTVTGASGESVQTRCIKEDGEWKVALELPPLSPIYKRERETSEELE